MAVSPKVMARVSDLYITPPMKDAFGNFVEHGEIFVEVDCVPIDRDIAELYNDQDLTIEVGISLNPAEVDSLTGLPCLPIYYYAILCSGIAAAFNSIIGVDNLIPTNQQAADSIYVIGWDSTKLRQAAPQPGEGNKFDIPLVSQKTRIRVPALQSSKPMLVGSTRIVLTKDQRYNYAKLSLRCDGGGSTAWKYTLIAFKDAASQSQGLALNWPSSYSADGWVHSHTSSAQGNELPLDFVDFNHNDAIDIRIGLAILRTTGGKASQIKTLGSVIKATLTLSEQSSL